MNLFLCSNSNNQIEDKIESLIISILATIVFLIIYEVIIKSVFAYFKNYKYKGKFIHCNNAYKAIVTNHKTHYSIIKLNFWRPNVLIVKSYDYNNPGDNIWDGEIKIDSGNIKQGFGTYSYSQGFPMGNHRIYIYEKDVIFVQVLDFRKIGGQNLWIREGNEKIIY